MSGDGVNQPRGIGVWTTDPVVLRPYTAGDRSAVTALLNRLSPQSKWFRFHGGVGNVPDELVDRVVSGHPIVALAAGRIVAVGSYCRTFAATAEAAFAVEDSRQGHGIGTLLFQRLAHDARAEGFVEFVAYVLLENRRMIDLLRHVGFAMSRTLESGELQYHIKLGALPPAVRSLQEVGGGRR